MCVIDLTFEQLTQANICQNKMWRFVIINGGKIFVKYSAQKHIIKLRTSVTQPAIQDTDKLSKAWISNYIWQNSVVSDYIYVTLAAASGTDVFKYLWQEAGDGSVWSGRK